MASARRELEVEQRGGPGRRTWGRSRSRARRRGRGRRSRSGCRSCGRGCVRVRCASRRGRAVARGRCGRRARTRRARRSRPRSRSTASASSKRRGSRLIPPISNMTVVPALISTPPSVVVRRARRKWLFTGASRRKISSTNVGIALRSARSDAWSARSSTRNWSANARLRAVVSWPAANRNAASLASTETGGVRPVGKGDLREVREHVGARCVPTVFDVAGEGALEERE